MRPGPIPTNNFTNMSRVVKTFDGYLMLLDAVYFNGLRIGNISEDGITWGGEEAQTIELWAAQIRTNPVKEVRTRDATNEITGKMIECVARNLKTLLGGTVTEERWDAPAESMIAEGDMKILAGTGATIDIRRVTLRASNMRGGLGGENTLGVEFGFKILAPDRTLHRSRDQVALIPGCRRRFASRHRSLRSFFRRARTRWFRYRNRERSRDRRSCGEYVISDAYREHRLHSRS